MTDYYQAVSDEQLCACAGDGAGHLGFQYPKRGDRERAVLRGDGDLSVAGVPALGGRVRTVHRAAPRRRAARPHPLRHHRAHRRLRWHCQRAGAQVMTPPLPAQRCLPLTVSPGAPQGRRCTHDFPRRKRDARMHRYLPSSLARHLCVLCADTVACMSLTGEWWYDIPHLERHQSHTVSRDILALPDLASPSVLDGLDSIR